MKTHRQQTRLELSRLSTILTVAQLFRTVNLSLILSTFLTFSAAFSAQPPESTAEPLNSLSRVIHWVTSERPPASRQMLIDRLSPEFFTVANHALFYHSESPCQSDVNGTTPRVVLFSKKTNLLVAYTGKTDGKCKDKIEFIQNNRPNKTYDFASIDFADLNHPIAYVLRKSLNSSEVAGHRWSTKDRRWQPDLNRCSKCHGSDPAPIWNSGSEIWHSVFGAFQGVLDPSSQEGYEFKSFLANSWHLPAYKRLEGYSLINQDLSNLIRGEPAAVPLLSLKLDNSQTVDLKTLVPNFRSLKEIDDVLDAAVPVGNFHEIGISVEMSKPATEVQKIGSILRSTPEMIDFAPPLVVYTKHCAICHDGRKPKSPQIDIHQEADFFKYRTEMGESILDRVLDHTMPKMINEESPEMRRSWSRHKKAFIEFLKMGP